MDDARPVDGRQIHHAVVLVVVDGTSIDRCDGRFVTGDGRS